MNGTVGRRFAFTRPRNTGRRLSGIRRNSWKMEQPPASLQIASNARFLVAHARMARNQIADPNFAVPFTMFATPVSKSSTLLHRIPIRSRSVSTSAFPLPRRKHSFATRVRSVRPSCRNGNRKFLSDSVRSLGNKLLVIIWKDSPNTRMSGARNTRLAFEENSDASAHAQPLRPTRDASREGQKVERRGRASARGRSRDPSGRIERDRGSRSIISSEIFGLASSTTMQAQCGTNGANASPNGNEFRL